MNEISGFGKEEIMDLSISSVKSTPQVTTTGKTLMNTSTAFAKNAVSDSFVSKAQSFCGNPVQQASKEALRTAFKEVKGQVLFDKISGFVSGLHIPSVIDRFLDKIKDSSTIKKVGSEIGVGINYGSVRSEEHAANLFKDALAKKLQKLPKEELQKTAEALKKNGLIEDVEKFTASMKEYFTKLDAFKALKKGKAV